MQAKCLGKSLFMDAIKKYLPHESIINSLNVINNGNDLEVKHTYNNIISCEIVTEVTILKFENITNMIKEAKEYASSLK